MYISVNKKGEIKQVGVSTDPNLTSLYVNEDAEFFPFAGWSAAKICCYKVRVVDGIIMMMTPYVDSRLLEHFDQLGKQTEYNADDISDNREGIMESFEASMLNTDDISALRDGLEEVYEMLLTESEE